MYTVKTSGRALMGAFALLFVLTPVRAFGQLSVDELELMLRPEQPAQRTSVFRVTNNTGSPIQAMLDVQDWNRDENGVNKFAPLSSAAGTCGEHLKVFPLSIRIDAHGTEAVRVTFDGPAQQSCWGIVFVQANEPPPPPEKKSQITYVMRTGVKIYVEPENAVRSGEVDSVKLSETAASETDTTKVPAIELRFRNDGSAHLKPTGAVEVRSADNQVAARLPIAEFPIAPGDVRRIVLRLPALPAGRYVALGLVDYGGSDIAAGQLEFEVK